MSARGLTGVLAVLVAVSLAAGAEPARAQPTGDRDATPGVRLMVEQMTGVVTPGGDFSMRVRVHNRSSEALESTRVVVSVYQRTDRRILYQLAVDEGEIHGSLLGSVAVDLEVVPPGGSALAEPRETAVRLGLRPHGVYPLRVQVLDEGEPLDEVFTSVVFSATEVEPRVAVAFVAPLDAVPGRVQEDVYHGDRVAASLAPGGRVHDLLGALAGHADVPVTVATSGLLLEQAADLSDGFFVQEYGELREAGPDTGLAREAERFLTTLADTLARDGVEHLALPYGPGDLVALTRGGLASEAVRLLNDGVRTSEALTGIRPVATMLWPPDGLDPATLAHAQAAGITTLLLSERHLTLAHERGQFTPSPVRRLRSPVGRMDVLVPDPWLERVMADSAALEHGRVVAAQRILAETAVVYFEQPGAEARALLLAPPDQRWFPAPGLVRTLLQGITAAPWLEPVTLTQLAGSSAREEDGVQLAYTDEMRDRELPGSYVQAMAFARQALGSFAQVVPEDPTPERFDRMLLQAASVHYRHREFRADGEALLDEVAGTISSVYRGVVVPEAPAVTLTSVEGQVPVTLRNDSPLALHVRVSLSTRALEFPEGAWRDLELAAGSAQTLLFPARTLIPGGSAPVTVTVEDPVGAMTLASGQLVVRTTAYSVAALVVTGGAALFLLVWLAREGARRRRLREPGEVTVDEPSPVA